MIMGLWVGVRINKLCDKTPKIGEELGNPGDGRFTFHLDASPEMSYKYEDLSSNPQCLLVLQVWFSKIGSRKRWEDPRM